MGLSDCNEKSIYAKFLKDCVLSANEIYLPTSLLTKFVDECNTNNVIILGVDFFTSVKVNVIPYEELLAFDASSLYAKAVSEKDRKKCNEFILCCYNKTKEELKGKFFTAVLE